MRHEPRRGSQIVEFTLASIPLIFFLIGIFGVGIAMWGYHSVAAGVKNATRVAATRGSSCAGEPCATTIGYYAQMMLSSGVPAASTVTFTSAGGNATCATLSGCANVPTVWPSTAGSTLGSDVSISASFPFQALLPMLTIAGSSTIGSANFAATSQQMVLF